MRSTPRGRVAAGAVVPLLAGATAAAAVVLLLGWPDLPPLPGHEGTLAARAVAAVALLLVVVPALPARRRGGLTRSGRSTAAAREVTPRGAGVRRRA